MVKKLLFENVTCSRCGGSGEYSYCSMYGRRCFKCAGAGVTLTKRGHAAQLWLNEARKKALADFAVGESFLSDGVPGFSASKWVTVDAVTVDGDKAELTGLDDKGERHTFSGTTGTMLRKRMTNEEVAALKKAGLAYQSTLTKSGTVMKRAAAKAA